MEPAQPSAIPTRFVAAALLAVLGVAAYWRFVSLGDPGLWLDEILGVRGVGPEHGPAYYAVMRATTGDRPDEVLTRLPFAIAGLASVAVAFACGRAISGPWFAVMSAAFVGTSPVHLFYSREARPYALLVLAGFVGLYAAIRLTRADGRPWPWLLALGGAAAGAVLTSANGIFVAAALLGAAWWCWPAGPSQRIAWLVALAAITVTSLVLLRQIYPAPAGTLAGGPPASAVAAAVLPILGPMVSGHLEQFPVRPATWIALGLAVAGAAILAWRTPRVALALLTAAALGLVLPVATMLWLQHAISARYALAAFPGLALLIAAPAALLDRVRRPWAADGGWFVIATGLLLAALVHAQGDARRAALREKADWRRVAAMVVARSAPGDTVVVSSDWAEVCLGYYLPTGTAARRLVNVRERLDEAQRVIGGLPRAVLVTGGAHFTSYAAREWMRGFHRVWDSSREDIAITFYPDRPTYLATAIPAGEVAADEAALQRMLRSRIDMTVNAERFLLAGWQPREVDGATPFRRAEARAVIYLPVADRWPSALATRARIAPDIADRRLEVWMNGVPMTTVALDPEWRDVRVAVSRSSLKAGANLLELRTPGVPPGRGAAAAYQAIEIR